MLFKGKGSRFILLWIFLCVLCIGFTHATTVRPGSTGSAKTRSTHTTSHHNSHNGTTVATTLPTQPVNASKVTQASSAVTSNATSLSAVPTTTAAATITRSTTTVAGTNATTSIPTTAATTKITNTTSTNSTASGSTNPPSKPFSVQQTTISTSVVPSQGNSSNLSNTTSPKALLQTTTTTTILPASKPTSTKLSTISVSVSGNATNAVSLSLVVSTSTATTTKSTNSSSNATTLTTTVTNMTSSTLRSIASSPVTAPTLTGSSASAGSVSTSSHSVTTSGAQTTNTNKTTQQPVTQRNNATGTSSSLTPTSTMTTANAHQSQMHANHNQTKPSPAFTASFIFTGTSSTNSSTYTAEITTDVSESSSTTTNSITSTGAFHSDVNSSVSSTVATTAAAAASHSSPTKTFSNNNTVSTTSPGANTSTLSSFRTSSSQTSGTPHTTFAANSAMSTGASPSPNTKVTASMNTTNSTSSSTKTSPKNSTMSTASPHAGTKRSSISSLGTSFLQTSGVHLSTSTAMPAISYETSTSSTSTVHFKTSVSSLSTTKWPPNSSTISTLDNTTTSLISPNSTTSKPKQTSSTVLFSVSNSSSSVTQSITKSTSNATANLTTTSLPGSPVNTTSDTMTVSTQVSPNTSHASTPSSKPLSIPSSPRTSPRASSTTYPLLTNQSSSATNGTITQSTTASTTPDPCASIVCQHGGTCVSYGTTANCTCSPGYSGRNCSVDINECTSSPCQNNGTCHDMVNDFNCSCVAGFTDKMCKTNIDDCATHLCQHGKCIDLVNAFNCSCDPGYTGPTCGTDINECSSSPCQNNGTCHDMVNGFNCSCVTGFTDKMCQTNINECDSNPCQNGGTCNDQINGFSCSCVLGYNGTMCQNNIDDCVQSLCEHGSTCVDGVNNYTCQCPSGWEGLYCNIDVDECQRGSHHCSKFANCSNNNGGYNCTCDKGFTGNGFECQDINECSNSSLNDCVNGTCFNLYGTYSCICNRGWTGTQCNQDINECAASPCEANADCTNLNGSYSCDCRDGYSRQGAKCTYRVMYEVVDDVSQKIPVLRGDDDIKQVYLPQGLRYYGKIYSYAYVSTNGYISLGQRYYNRAPSTASKVWSSDPPVIAPLWADIDVSSNKSGVYINSLTYDKNFDVLKNFTDVCGFEPNYALMATWKNAAPFPAIETLSHEHGDFQAVLASNGTHTKLILNYDQSRFTWQMAPARSVAVGFSNEANVSSSMLYTSDNFLSVKSGSNINITGRWVFEVANSGNPVEASCRSNATKMISDLISFFDKEPCPCTYAQARRDRRFRFTGSDNGVYKFHATFSSGGFISFTSRQLCHYNNHGSLLIGEPNGGYVTAVSQRAGFNMDDLYKDCCVNSNLCYLFYLWNPSDTCRNYKPPSWASGWGDPHIVTLDGKEYTFNGRGEYVLLRTSDNFMHSSLEVQVRTQLVNSSSNDSTVIVGLAAKEKYNGIDGDTVELQLNRTTQAVSIFINNTLNQTIQSSDQFDLTGSNFVLYKDGDELVLAFKPRFSLQIKISDVMSIVGNAVTNDVLLKNMKGLLGNNDGDNSNDFVARNGTVFDAKSSEEQTWYFGNSWMLQTSNESLFTYTPGFDFDFFNNPTIKPKLFISDILSNRTNYLSYVNRTCSGITERDVNETCKASKACLVDIALTCNKGFGKQTKDVLTNNTENARIAANSPPTIDGPTHIISKEGNETVIRIMDDTDSPADFKMKMNMSRPQITWTNINETTYVLTWNFTKQKFQDQIPYFQLSVTDTLNATRTYSPTFLYCDCHSYGECDDSSGTAEKFRKMSCTCESGKTGQRCETDIDLCATSTCYNTSDCTVLNGEPQCGDCPQGLSKSGNKCYDINECDNGHATCEQLCTNTRGSYTCDCRSGFLLASDKSSCTEINECSTGANTCDLNNNEICVNTPGSYECRCRSGFINESNSCRHALVQFVGVLAFKLTIGQGDVNTILKKFLFGVFNSSMPLVSVEIIDRQNTRMRIRKMKPLFYERDFILYSNKSIDTRTVQESWDNFTRKDRCDEHKCELLVDDNGLTVFINHSKVYSDQENMLCAIENKRCDGVSTHCTSSNGMMTCSCRPGFSPIENVVDRCLDIDECQSLTSPCNGGTCINTPGNYTCRCPAGYGYISGKCTDLCSSSPCLNGGTCIHGQNEKEFVCKCDDKWAGLTCERENEEASRLRTALIAVGASVGGLCFLMLMALLGMCRRSRQKHKAYLHQRAMSSINGYESSKLQFHDEPYDDDPAEPSTFVIPRPHVTGQFEMQRTDSDEKLVAQDDTAAKFSDPAKPSATGSSDNEEKKGKENPSFLHSEGSQKDERRRSKNPYEYF